MSQPTLFPDPDQKLREASIARAARHRRFERLADFVFKAPGKTTRQLAVASGDALTALEVAELAGDAAGLAAVNVKFAGGRLWPVE